MRVMIIIGLVFSLFYCATKADKIRSGQEYWDEAMSYYSEGRYGKAAESFEYALMYGESPEMVRLAQFYVGDSHYNAKKYDEAIAAFEIYVTYYKSDYDTGEALYKLAMSHLESAPKKQRDQTDRYAALRYLKRLQVEYPEYAEKVDVDDHVAKITTVISEKEIDVAKYYIKAGNDVGAAKRLKFYIDHYPDSERADYVLLLLVETLLRAGYTDEVDIYADMMIEEYPNSPYTEKMLEILR